MTANDDDRALLCFLASTVMGWPAWNDAGDPEPRPAATFYADLSGGWLCVYWDGGDHATPWNPLADLRDAGHLLDRFSGYELRRAPYEGSAHRCIAWDDRRVGWASEDSRERAVCLAAARAYGWNG